MGSTYLILVVILTILGKATAQCRPGDINNYNTSEQCNIIYDAIETALVTNDNNLYILREGFFPTTHNIPVLLEIQYNIQRTDNVTLPVKLGWTESGVFAAINPRTLLSLQLRAIYWPLRYLLLDPRDITLVLDLKDSTETSDAPDREIAAVLDLINSRVSYIFSHSDHRYTAMCVLASCINSWHDYMITNACYLKLHQ